MYIGKRVKAGSMLKSRDDVDSRAKGKKEDCIQAQCEAVLSSLGVRFIHIPDIVYRMCSRFSPLKIWEKAIISKYLKSLPDLVIFLNDGRYICVELKTTTGTHRQGQKKFARDVGEKNYHLARSVEGFKEVLRKYDVDGRL